VGDFEDFRDHEIAARDLAFDVSSSYYLPGLIGARVSRFAISVIRWGLGIADSV
jgi:hypothetical protein